MKLDKKRPYLLQCPVCKNFLIDSSTAYYCKNNHHFDKSKKGYLNLLLSTQKRSNNPGDCKEMIQSRFDFLNKEYYQPIAENILKCLQDAAVNSLSSSSVIDIGCGVGYYLNFIHKSETSPLELYGIDISKEAIKKAATAYQDSAHWMISSMKDLPFMNKSIGYVLSIFAPFQADEIHRILIRNGYLLTVTPATNHLIECRRKLFDHVKEIDACKIEGKLAEGFSLLKTLPIFYQIELEKNNIENLLRMTPYYWKSDQEKRIDLQSLPKIAVTIDVVLRVFQKKQRYHDGNN